MLVGLVVTFTLSTQVNVISFRLIAKLTHTPPPPTGGLVGQYGQLGLGWLVCWFMVGWLINMVGLVVDFL